MQPHQCSDFTFKSPFERRFDACRALRDSWEKKTRKQISSLLFPKNPLTEITNLKMQTRQEKEQTRQLGPHWFLSLPERTDYEYPCTHPFQLERPPQLAPTNSFWEPADPTNKELQVVSKYQTQTETAWKLMESNKHCTKHWIYTLMQLSLQFEQKELHRPWL